MKWIAWILVGLGLIITIVAVVGLFLPKAHTAARTVRLSAPPDVVWAVITNYRQYPEWRGEVKKIEPLTAQRGYTSWREYYGENDYLTLEVVESIPPERLVVRIADENLPFGGRWIYDIESSEPGSKLTLTEEGVIYNVFFRVISKFLIGHAATIENFLSALQDKLAVSDSSATSLPATFYIRKRFTAEVRRR